MSIDVSRVNSLNTNHFVSTVTIANGQSLSDAVNLGGSRLMNVMLPATWTTASITFQISLDGVTYGDYFDYNGNEHTGVATAGKPINVDPTVFADVQFLKIRSGTSGTPVAQGGDRSIQISSRVY